MSEFPHPKHATDELVEELRLKYDFPSFPKLKDMGHGTIFSKEEEAEMKLFLSDCCVLSIPRIVEEFKEDARVYYNVKSKDSPTPKKYVFGKVLLLFTEHYYFNANNFMDITSTMFA